MNQFNADYRRQLHFNYLATWTTHKLKQAFGAIRASHLRDINLDALPDSTLLTIISSKWQDLSRYILEDILDCPVGSSFIVCIATEDNNDKWSKYYSETARLIQSDFRRKSLPVETWRMSSKRYLVLQGRITRSSLYNDISMKSITQRQFCDAFSNNSGDVAHRTVEQMHYALRFTVRARTIICQTISKNESAACTPHILPVCFGVLR